MFAIHAAAARKWAALTVETLYRQAIGDIRNLLLEVNGRALYIDVNKCVIMYIIIDMC